MSLIDTAHNLYAKIQDYFEHQLDNHTGRSWGVLTTFAVVASGVISCGILPSSQTAAKPTGLPPNSEWTAIEVVAPQGYQPRQFFIYDFDSNGKVDAAGKNPHNLAVRPEWIDRVRLSLDGTVWEMDNAMHGVAQKGLEANSVLAERLYSEKD